jgi:hypothetical protein
MQPLKILFCKIEACLPEIESGGSSRAILGAPGKKRYYNENRNEKERTAIKSMYI